MSSDYQTMNDPMPNLPPPETIGWDPMAEKGVDPAIAKARREREKIYRSFKKCFDNDEGRVVMHYLMTQSYYHGILGRQASLNEITPAEMGRREGLRELYFTVLNLSRMTFDEIDQIKLGGAS
jgi:hypothetical protein